MKPVHFFTVLYAITAAAPMASAHEFWIEPAEFQVENDTPIQADLRNGELFKGSAQSYFEDRNTRLEAVMGNDTTLVEGRMGDRPAIALPAPQKDGLLILAHEAAPSTLNYKKWAKFIKFVKHKDFTHAEDIHAQRGWAQENFKESYTRHSKALVAVGDGAGADQALGMATEFVALENPYAADFDGGLDVSLLYEGAPRADAQIEVYARDANKNVEVTILRTDDEGQAVIPTQAGYTYLLDAVVMRPFDGATTIEAGPVWETLWASMTFAVPAR